MIKLYIDYFSGKNEVLEFSPDIKQLDFSNMEISGLWNLESFKYLTDLDLSNNKITAICTLPESLINLDLSNNDIRGITLNYLKNLRTLRIHNNGLSELILPESVELLDCGKNLVSDVPYSPALKYLDCSDNLLISIDKLSDILEVLKCSENDIEYIRNIPKTLKVLHCDSNKLYGLNLSEHNNLIILRCGDNYGTKFITPKSLLDSDLK